MLSCVQEKPYEADCEWVYVNRLPSGEVVTSTTSGMVARDSSGRRLQQCEVIKSEGDAEREVWSANIYDPESQTLHFIDLRSGTTLGSLPLALGLDHAGAEAPALDIDVKWTPPRLDEPESTERMQGQQVIEGMLCTGYCRKAGGWEIEYWVADELEETLRYRVETGDLKATVRVFNILRSEPDPELFAIRPPGQRPEGAIYLRLQGNSKVPDWFPPNAYIVLP